MQVAKLFSDAQALHKKGRLEPAAKIYRRILTLDPNHAHSLIFLAIIEQAQGNIEDALNYGERAYANSRADPLILVNYGIILKNARKFDLAIKVYNDALSYDPKLISARTNLATVYMLSGRLAESESEFQKVSEQTEDVAPLLNLARISIAKDDLDSAQSYFDTAESRDPGHKDIAVVRALIAKKDRNDEVAYKSAVKALQSNPLSYEVWQTIRGVDSSVLAYEELESLFELLLKTKSTNAGVFAAAVDLARKNTLWKYLSDLESRLTQGLESQDEIRGSSSDAFTLLGADLSQRAHRKLAEYLWSDLHKEVNAHVSKKRDMEEGEKLRVGFLSFDFRNHAIGYLIVGLFESLPSKKVQYYAYSNSDDDGSETRRRIAQSVHKFTNVNKLSDSELNQVIRKDQIDILVDLSQMTSGTRASVLRYRPAPVQMQWLGMPGTLGMDCCDYIIGDKWVIDSDNIDGFSEVPILLDRSYQPNDHVKPDLTLGGARGDHDLPDDAVVLCSFNQHYKFSPGTVKLWGAIMRDVPNSVLWLLKPKSETHVQHLLEVFESFGINRERIVFAGHRPQKEHIARIAHADLILDTWPYNAHTTCSDALRAGVPVVTCPGRTFASRVAQGILETGGLPEWIASSHEEYVKIAVHYAQKTRDGINRIKSKVSETYWSSPMVDNNLFGVILENMFVNVFSAHDVARRFESLVVDSTGELEEVSALHQPFISNRNKSNSVPISEGEADQEVKNLRDRMQNLHRLKRDVIGLSGQSLIVEVGAADFEWDKSPITDLVNAKLVNLLGFEPDHRSFAKLEQQKQNNVKYINSAVGDGSSHILNLCNGAHMSSILKPDNFILEDFMGYSTAKVVETVSVDTVRLDDVEEAKSARMLKIDTQGFELSILKNAEVLLSNLMAIHFEASFLTMYVDQPSLFTIGSWLEERGFSLLNFNKFNYLSVKTEGFKSAEFGRSQLLEVDAVFIPSPERWVEYDQESLKQMAFLLHSIYNAFDVSLRILATSDDKYSTKLCRPYFEYLKETGLYA